MSSIWTIGQRPNSRIDPALPSGPDWAQAAPPWIKRALNQVLKKPSGGWFVIDGCRNIGTGPTLYRIGGRDLVVWRAEQMLFVAPDACPHMGASLACGTVVGAQLRCPWHGLGLGKDGHGTWKPYPSYDDGVLLWARLDDVEPGIVFTSKPTLAQRPAHFLDSVIRIEAGCEPEDVIANRLDPWHGVHFHPHSFARLSVIDKGVDSITVRVAYRVLGPISVEVDACFHAPDPRTIVMTIVDGEGTGSVVETHATPIDAGRTAIVEATLATSERTGFRLARSAAKIVRPWIARSAKRLWVEDAAYAERTYQRRQSI
ncbi:MAG: Rieske 2Fe-2S domain-containing protein [Myxococcales bacterium]|nr:Rieske 2Fe-2S domain-containing protein [Myxococcales bacterium]MCB9707455.1 Rieske 2Fe-2S domain-containing protein [Myxococcales bacterium]